MSGTPAPVNLDKEPVDRFATQSLPRRIVDELKEWFQTEGVVWIFIFKTVLSALLSLYLSMLLQLDSPRTAVISVFIVMTPQSGMVISKSFYRICGTLAGVIAGLALIGLFAQQRELFLCALAVWVGICTAGAARNRNFLSYGYVLAGYTAAIVGVPNAQQALGAFDAGVTRALEVLLGVIVSALVSSILFPKYSSPALRAQINKRYGAFVDFLTVAADGRVDRAAIEKRNLEIIADVVSLEALRSYAIFEDPIARLQVRRFEQLNSESMTLATRFHALNQLLTRLAIDPTSPIPNIMSGWLGDLARCLSIDGDPVKAPADATKISPQLHDFNVQLSGRLGEKRVELSMQLTPAAMLDFDTAVQLLLRFIDELSRYVSTFALLAHQGEARSTRDRWRNLYVAKTNPLIATIAGGRAAITMLLVSVIWITTAWPSGNFATFFTGTICALLSPAPQPAKATIELLKGSILAGIVGYFITFHVFVRQDGFVLLAASFLPFLMFGVWLMTRRKYMFVGMGYLVFLGFLVAPANLTDYDAGTYINNTIGLLFAAVISLFSFAIILPPTSSFLLRYMARDLRKQVRLAAFGMGDQLSHRFENGTRDFMSQLVPLTAGQPILRRSLLGWMFSVLEVGHAVIELRSEFEKLPLRVRVERGYQEDAPWRDAILVLKGLLASFFTSPSRKKWALTFDANARAISLTQSHLASLAVTSEYFSEDSDRLLRILSYLNFVRTALLDTEAPMAIFHPLMDAPVPGRAA